MKAVTLALVFTLTTESLAAVTCLKVGATAKATWKNSAAKTCTWTGIIGSNFGKNSLGSEYVSVSFSLFLMESKVNVFQLQLQRPMWSWMYWVCSGECLVRLMSVGHVEVKFDIGNSTQDCFSHDVCSNFNSASGGARLVHFSTLKVMEYLWC